MWEGPYGNWGSRKYLMASLDQSLKRMGLDYVDLFYSHRYDLYIQNCVSLEIRTTFFFRLLLILLLDPRA